MRIRLSFLKAFGTENNGVISLHHQKILCSFLEQLIESISHKSDCYCFSSLKGTTKVSNGQIRFLSNKVSLVFSDPEKDFVNAVLQKIFESGDIHLDKLALSPRSYQIISEPNFQTVMKYVCISPMIPSKQFVETETPLHPSSHEFSDRVFDSIIHRMEQCGYSDGQLNDFSEFEITPDTEYFQKIENNPRKHARVYKNGNFELMYGYLFPFSVHAHPEVHKFFWERGLGLSTKEGYGMIDMVPGCPPSTDHILP
jgi:CRISPR-associated endoribonuclease Cas6